jgi:hypothetical protein
MAITEEKIVIGSGELYVQEFTGEVPADSVIEDDDNLIGRVQGGATLTYKPKYVNVADDLGYVNKTILTEEEVTLKSGILTWNGDVLGKLNSTARVTEDGNTRTVKIGGIANQDGKNYLIRFLHKDAVDGNMHITIVGNNQAGFALAFVKDKETVIDAEFTAFPVDDEGTKIIFTEDIAVISA